MATITSLNAAARIMNDQRRLFCIDELLEGGLDVLRKRRPGHHSDRRSVLREAGVNPELEATAWRRWVAFRSERFVLSSVETTSGVTFSRFLGELLTCDDVSPRNGEFSWDDGPDDGDEESERSHRRELLSLAIFSFSAISLFRANFFIRIVSFLTSSWSTPPIAIFRSVR
ncbi:hypothetical protein GWK47_012702 [Chionoecetes opilio]|uniref:Uncharacterized protein n=1 Tax=Chionoecetes opilio TaxID=41210 RepID=A0A8J4XYU9_CHIOP|nr:hypothetical protein GWK47_012702 [Chionoecetes opilio]